MEGLNVVALVVIVVVVALANERIVELLIKLHLIKGEGDAAAWQSVIGALAMVALALARHIGIESEVTNSVDALVQAATALALLIPIFAQAGIAKLAHEAWKRIGWVTEVNQINSLLDRG